MISYDKLNQYEIKKNLNYKVYPEGVLSTNIDKGALKLHHFIKDYCRDAHIDSGYYMVNDIVYEANCKLSWTKLHDGLLQFKKYLCYGIKPEHELNTAEDILKYLVNHKTSQNDDENINLIPLYERVFKEIDISEGKVYDYDTENDNLPGNIKFCFRDIFGEDPFDDIISFVYVYFDFFIYYRFLFSENHEENK